MHFDNFLKLLSGKKYSKSKQTKYSEFVKLDVQWAERDTDHYQTKDVVKIFLGNPGGVVV